MIIKLQKYYEGSNLSGAVSSVINIEVGEAMTLKEVRVSGGANVSGADAVFALKKNGVAISGADVTVSVGTKKGEATGLNVALAEDDELDLALLSGAINSPVVLTLTVDDGVSIDGLLPDQTGNSGKVLETDGTTASWQTPSGGGGGSVSTTFEDDFNDNSLDAAKWQSAPTGGAETGNRFQIAHNASVFLKSQSAHNLYDKRITAEIPQVSAASASHATQFFCSAADTLTSVIGMDVNNGNLRCFVGGAAKTITYNSGNHRWWRFILRYGGVTFQVSADGSTWSTIYMAAIGSVTAPDAMFVYLRHFNSAGGANTTSIFDNVKIENIANNI